jgi:ribose/xylose/arabinose/galactoside ABC-type transport system permease subunit
MNIANLFKVKTIVTLAVVFTFCYLTHRGIQLSNEFVMIATAVVTYYFTKPDSKKDTDDHYYDDDRGYR